jgi:prepilin-type N-terminal cleavage/methylation domain-containing protein
MRNAAPAEGYTLIEIIIALLVFTVGALALAASSGVIAKAMATSNLRERANRAAVSRLEAIESQCASAKSGRETINQIESEWVVTPTQLATQVDESIKCVGARKACTATYHAVIWCPR